MPAPPPDATSQLATVTSVVPCGSDGVLLTVETGEAFPRLDAARFFMLRCEDGTSPLIPRPFSLFRQRGARLEFLIKVMGAGTRALAGAAIGSEVRLIGPLGHGFPEPDDEQPLVMLVGRDNALQLGTPVVKLSAGATNQALA